MAPRTVARDAHIPTLTAISDLVHIRSNQRLQFIDLTELVRERVDGSGIWQGIVNVQVKHTTCAVVVNENEPLLLEDMATLLERWAPSDGTYRHNDLEARCSRALPEERPNGDAHARAVCLGASETLNISESQLQLGRWQRVLFVELDGPRTRRVSIVVLGQMRMEL